MSRDIVDYALVFRADLHQLPPELVIRAARRHLDALRHLKPGVFDRDQAVDDLEAFLAEHPDLA